MYLVLWQEPFGIRKWEAVRKEQLEGFLAQLINDGVRPATVHVAHNPTNLNWVWKKYHGGRSNVPFSNINEEILGGEPVEDNHEPVSVPDRPVQQKRKFGWLSPDGRLFHCQYGGHSHLADQIVGEIEHIINPERHLEDLGWAKILTGGSFKKTYAVAMGIDKKLTDEQIKTLQRIGCDDIYIGEWFL